MNLSGCGEGSFAQMAKTDGERSTKVSRFEFADRVLSGLSARVCLRQQTEMRRQSSSYDFRLAAVRSRVPLSQAAFRSGGIT